MATASKTKPTSPKKSTKKTAPQKAAPKKTASRKASPKKAPAKKTAPAKKAPAKKTAAVKKTTPNQAAPKKTAPKQEKQENQAKAKSSQAPKHVEGNPYRAGSSYAVCFDCLAKMGKDKPVSRKKLLEEYAKDSGKDEKRAKYDLAVILSPTKEGTGHRSSRKLAYWVERLNGMVRLHMAL